MDALSDLTCGLLTEYGEKWAAGWEELKAKAVAMTDEARRRLQA